MSPQAIMPVPPNIIINPSIILNFKLFHFFDNLYPKMAKPPVVMTPKLKSPIEAADIVSLMNMVTVPPTTIAVNEAFAKS